MWWSRRGDIGALEYRRARDRRRRRWTVTLVGIGLAAGGTLGVRQIDHVTSPHATDKISSPSLDRRTDRAHRTPVRGGSFAFVAEQVMSERPVAYDPCRPVPWAFLDGAPPGTMRIVEQAVRALARATGLTFVRRSAPGHAVYGALTTNYGRDPITIGWARPAEVPALTGPEPGVGSSIYMSDHTGERRYVTGAVALDRPQIQELLDRPRGTALARAGVLHALAHVVGLDHVDDPGELMFDGVLTRTGFGPGDRRGLARLGAGSCLR